MPTPASGEPAAAEPSPPIGVQADQSVEIPRRPLSPDAWTAAEQPSPPWRPGRVTVAAVLLFARAALGVPAAVILARSALVDSAALVMGGFAVVVGAGWALLGYFLIRGRGWARTTTVVLAAVDAASGLLVMLVARPAGGVGAGVGCGAALNALIVALLSHPDSREYFRQPR